MANELILKGLLTLRLPGPLGRAERDSAWPPVWMRLSSQPSSEFLRLADRPENV